MRHKLSVETISLSDSALFDFLAKAEKIETRGQWFTAGEAYFALAKTLSSNQSTQAEAAKAFVRSATCFELAIQNRDAAHAYFEGSSILYCKKISFQYAGELFPESCTSARFRYYKTRFAQGATIVPRSFWFVQVTSSPLGFNPDLPPLETAERALQEAKDAYKSVFFKDTVESRFLYATLLSTDLLPFGHLAYRLVVLPIEPEGDHYKLIGTNEARRQGFLHLARWLEKVEEEWTKRRRAKAEQMTALGWLDYRRKLTIQNPQTKYRVIYNTSGTFLTAAVVENQPIEFKIDGQKITARGFVADTKTYFCELKDLQGGILFSVCTKCACDR